MVMVTQNAIQFVHAHSRRQRATMQGAGPAMGLIMVYRLAQDTRTVVAGDRKQQASWL